MRNPFDPFKSAFTSNEAPKDEPFTLDKLEELLKLFDGPLPSYQREALSNYLHLYPKPLPPITHFMGIPVGTYAGYRIIYTDRALEKTEERLFPFSKHRSKRIHKKLIKRFGGEFKMKPAIFKIGHVLYVHPANKAILEDPNSFTIFGPKNTTPEIRGTTFKQLIFDELVT